MQFFGVEYFVSANRHALGCYDHYVAQIATPGIRSIPANG